VESWFILTTRCSCHQLKILLKYITMKTSSLLGMGVGSTAQIPSLIYRGTIFPSLIPIQ